VLNPMVAQIAASLLRPTHHPVHTGELKQFQPTHQLIPQTRLASTVSEQLWADRGPEMIKTVNG
jgi:hypothetical protein